MIRALCHMCRMYRAQLFIGRYHEPIMVPALKVSKDIGGQHIDHAELGRIEAAGPQVHVSLCTETCKRHFLAYYTCARVDRA